MLISKSLKGKLTLIQSSSTVESIIKRTPLLHSFEVRVTYISIILLAPSKAPSSMFEILLRLKSTLSKLGKRLNNPNAGMDVILLSFNSSLFVVFGKSIGISREDCRGKKTRLGLTLLASYCDRCRVKTLWERKMDSFLNSYIWHSMLKQFRTKFQEMVKKHALKVHNIYSRNSPATHYGWFGLGHVAHLVDSTPKKHMLKLCMMCFTF